MLKRVFDIVGSGLGLLVLAPVIALVAILVRFEFGTPILFRQKRPGKLGRPFDMVKFRTMTDARSADGALLSDAARLTGFGKWLRSTSLDELPELWNVFRGDMSLVGPRPLLMQYLPLYSENQARRHLVRPGLTGWAQVRGRNALSWDDKFTLDVWYVDHRSFWLDAKIILLTVWKVLRRDDITSGNDATMAAFTGNKGDSGHG